MTTRVKSRDAEKRKNRKNRAGNGGTRIINAVGPKGVREKGSLEK